MTAKSADVQALIGKFGGSISTSNDAVQSRPGASTNSSRNSIITKSVSYRNSLSTPKTPASHKSLVCESKSATYENDNRGAINKSKITSTVDGVKAAVNPPKLSPGVETLGDKVFRRLPAPAAFSVGPPPKKPSKKPNNLDMKLFTSELNNFEDDQDSIYDDIM